MGGRREGAENRTTGIEKVSQTTERGDGGGNISEETLPSFLKSKGEEVRNIFRLTKLC